MYRFNMIADDIRNVMEVLKTTALQLSTYPMIHCVYLNHGQDSRIGNEIKMTYRMDS